jgi:hypothetical protein
MGNGKTAPVLKYALPGEDVSGGGDVKSTFSSSRQYLEVRGQLHAGVALPQGKGPSVRIVNSCHSYCSSYLQGRRALLFLFVDGFWQTTARGPVPTRHWK